MHSPCSEPRKKRSCLHHAILSYPVQADGGQAPPVSSHSSVHTGCKKLGLHNLSWELHCNITVVAWPTFESYKHCADFTATSAEKGKTPESKQNARALLLCAASKIKLRTDYLPLSAGKKNNMKELESHRLKSEKDIAEKFS